MDAKALKKAAIFGIAGTVAMTVFAFIANYLHLPKVGIHGMVAAHIPIGGDIGSWGIYFALGIILAFVYKAYFHPLFPIHPIGKGVFYGFSLWIIMQVIMMPVLGMGFFAGSMVMAIGPLLGLAFYGATVGYLYEKG